MWAFYTYGKNGVWSCYKEGYQKLRKTSEDEKRGVGCVGNGRQTVQICQATDMLNRKVCYYRSTSYLEQW